jgi:hypothetical protein
MTGVSGGHAFEIPRVELYGRCAKELAPKDRELCWFCEGPLCYDGWEDIGVCGCSGSEEAQEDTPACPLPGFCGTWGIAA